MSANIIVATALCEKVEVTHPHEESAYSRANHRDEEHKLHFFVEYFKRIVFMFKHPYEVYEVHFFPVDPSTVAVTRSYITSKWTKLIFNRCFSFFLRGATYSDDKVPLGHRTEGLRVDFFVP